VTTIESGEVRQRKVRTAALDQAVYATVSEFARLSSANKLAVFADFDKTVLDRAYLYELYLTRGVASARDLLTEGNAQRRDLPVHNQVDQ
jgi:hypothetical protein